jgi:hypothetical protein
MFLHFGCPIIQNSVQNAKLQARFSHHGHKPVGKAVMFVAVDSAAVMGGKNPYNPTTTKNPNSV